jgi:hypothetical protein
MRRTLPSRAWAPGSPGDPAAPGEWYEVIGVVRELGVGTPTQPGRAAGLYLPATPDLFDEIQMMVRVRGGDPMTLAPQVRDVATAVDPALRVVEVQRGDQANSECASPLARATSAWWPPCSAGP